MTRPSSVCVQNLFSKRVCVSPSVVASDSPCKARISTHTFATMGHQNLFSCPSSQARERFARLKAANLALDEKELDETKKRQVRPKHRSMKTLPADTQRIKSRRIAIACLGTALTGSDTFRHAAAANIVVAPVERSWTQIDQGPERKLTGTGVFVAGNRRGQTTFAPLVL